MNELSQFLRFRHIPIEENWRGSVLLLQYSKSPVGVDYIANNIMTCK
jgi:hypothetical protein